MRLSEMQRVTGNILKTYMSVSYLKNDMFGLLERKILPAPAPNEQSSCGHWKHAPLHIHFPATI